MNEQFGPYRLVGAIAEGGMAQVYLAMCPSLSRQVALKVFSAQLTSDPIQVKRFAQEAKTVAALDHPHIVSVWDANLNAPPYYIVMEYMPGGTLADRMRARRLSIEETLRITFPLCHALDYAHQHGIIHRDIKPENILFNREGQPMLTDFGIARLKASPRLTARGFRLGTPEYMSPEQAKGLDVDYRADLYGLGVMVYEMLTGDVPFRRRDPLETMRCIVQLTPPPLRRSTPGIPPTLEAVVLRMLAKRPQERYLSGVAFAQALRQAVRTQAVPVAARARLWLLLLLVLIMLAIGILALVMSGMMAG